MSAVAQVAAQCDEAVRADGFEHEQRHPPRRHYAVVSFVGRLAVIALCLSGIAATIGVEPAILAAVVLSGLLLLVWSIRNALPPAVRFRILTEVVIVLAATFATIAVVEHGAVGMKRGQFGLVVAATLLLALVLETWTERNSPPVRVVLVGHDARSEEVAKALLDGDEHNWSLVGVVVNQNGNGVRPNTIPDESVPHEARNGSDRGPSAELVSLVSTRRPNLVVLSDFVGRDDALDGLLKIPTPSFRLVSFDHFCEYAFGRISMWSVSPLWFMSLLHAYQRPYRRVTKRVLDVLIASCTLVVMAPVIGATMLAVRLSGPGAIFYRQIRVGESGQPFEIFKFRTMDDGAELDGAAAWAAEKDVRVTGVGRLLRRFRLDELPQLWNIIKGEMSIVGPRPERPEFVEVLENDVPHWSRRQLVKPGLTGWAQVKMGYTADSTSAADKLAHDLYYIKHRGLMFDLVIVLRTLGVVVRGQGAR
jgi:exopolysaccharide biosynthesis polyprenyl glycosylphosphotransferase